ncbi:zinc finger protein [Aureococcus anophagefferens]|nr:zinc finger protein [Aureococcus anophagefferens]
MEQPSPLHGAGVALVDAQPDAEAGCCDDDGIDAPTPKDTLSEAELLAEEDASVEKRRGALGLKPASTHGLGLCFSGGGVRAASFDCGVLMKMGELGLLKEVDHLSAVSGGGYTASAYLTHLQYCEAPCPKGGKAADDWFRLRTAELVARMQDNIGYLITCAHSFNAAPGRERGSPYARCCDVPAFVALLLGMPAANVLTFVAFWALRRRSGSI